MNGHDKLHAAAERNGTWYVSDDTVNKMIRTQDFISDKYELFIQVTYCGLTIKSAILWDFSSKISTMRNAHGVPFHRLTHADTNKADRIVDVLLGNGRHF